MGGLKNMSAKKWNFSITPVRIMLMLIVLLSGAMIVYRLATGLGVSTNLNDEWPWGLWIIFDLTAVALAGAGYSMAVLTHILHIKDFMPLARRGLLISLLGYVFVLMTLILEIGRWDNAWRPLVSWGYHSPMFEVYIAITIYMIIQVFEFGEVLTEKVFKPFNKVLKVVLPTVFFLGALIPFGHQASLGAIFLIFPDKLNALWYSPMLPWFFLITSFYAGPAMVLLDTLFSHKSYDFRLNIKPLAKLAKTASYVMLAYFVWKLVDMIKLGSFNLIFTGGFEANMFLLEYLVGLAIPIIICLTPWIYTKMGLAAFSLLSIFGVVMSRLNVVYTGMYQTLGSGYTPNFVEWGISIGLLALVSLAYLFIVENFTIYNYKEELAVQETNLKDEQGSFSSVTAK